MASPNTKPVDRGLESTSRVEIKGLSSHELMLTSVLILQEKENCPEWKANCFLNVFVQLQTAATMLPKQIIPSPRFPHIAAHDGAAQQQQHTKRWQQHSSSNIRSSSSSTGVYTYAKTTAATTASAAAAAPAVGYVAREFWFTFTCVPFSSSFFVVGLIRLFCNVIVLVLCTAIITGDHS